MLWLVLIWLVFCQLNSVHGNRHKLCIIFSQKPEKYKVKRYLLFSKNHTIIYLLTSLAQAILRNIVPWSFLYGTLLHSVCTTSEGQRFPDFFQAGMLSALSTHSFSVLLCYYAKRGLQMAVIVTVKALHTLFSREKHVEVVLMMSVGNVFQYLYFLHMYPYLYILFSYHIFHSAYSSSISYFLLSWLYNDLNNAVINGDFPEDYLFWISCVDSRDEKEARLI